MGVLRREVLVGEATLEDIIQGLSWARLVKSGILPDPTSATNSAELEEVLPFLLEEYPDNKDAELLESALRAFHREQPAYFWQRAERHLARKGVSLLKRGSSTPPPPTHGTDRDEAAPTSANQEAS